MRRLIAILILLLAVSPASAGFTVSPTVLYITEQDGIATLFVKNGTATANVYQVGAAAWVDRSDPNSVGPTRDLVVSPQVFRLGPGETGRVRIRAATAGIGGSGKAYRILARQVTPEPRSGDLNVRIQVQFTVPLLTISGR